MPKETEFQRIRRSAGRDEAQPEKKPAAPAKQQGGGKSADATSDKK